MIAARTLISGGIVLTERGEASPLDLLLDGDTIAELLPRGAASGGDFTIIDATGQAIIPGLINAHTHGHGGLSKGSGDRWTLELLLNAGGWLGGQRTDDDRYMSTLLAAIEMLQKGCTACFDLSLVVPLPTADGMAAVAQAYTDAGMRAVVAPMIGDIHFYRAIPSLVDGAPAEFRRDMEQAAATDGASILASLQKMAAGWPIPADRVRFGLAPTIPLHCTDDFLVGCHRIAREHGLPLQTHLAESPAQAISAPRRYGRSITAHLATLGLIDASFSGAHGVWLDANDIALLGERGAAIAHNPGSNLRLGNGIADTRAMLNNGVTVGVGTDGGASADGQNMFEATRLACNLSRIQARPADAWLSAAEALQLATSGSANVLGMQDMIGRLAPGYKADMVFLDLGHINYVPLNNLVHQLVHVEDSTAVRRVMVGGRFVVENGRVLGVDMEAIARRAAATAERLRAANRETRETAERIAPFIARFCHGLTCDCELPHRRLENAG
jgi:5-methylthioadenosine/S-adenosylhomocysteine deaminase